MCADDLLQRVLLLLSSGLLPTGDGYDEGLLSVINSDRQRATTEQIWRELSDRLRQFVRSRIVSTADVDDVLQTVFLRIHSKLDDLRNVERLES